MVASAVACELWHFGPFVEELEKQLMRMFGSLPHLHRIIKRKCQDTDFALPHVSQACIGLFN
jgi:hypothetical protein